MCVVSWKKEEKLVIWHMSVKTVCQIQFHAIPSVRFRLPPWVLRCFRRLPFVFLKVTSTAYLFLNISRIPQGIFETAHNAHGSPAKFIPQNILNMYFPMIVTTREVYCLGQTPNSQNNAADS